MRPESCPDFGHRSSALIAGHEALAEQDVPQVLHLDPVASLVPYGHVPDAALEVLPRYQ